MNDERLEALLRETLERDTVPPQVDEAVAARLLTRLGKLPRQRQPLWRLPGILLDWQFAPAWPRMAVLASCAAVGFVIGLSGVDQSNDQTSTPYSFVSGGGDFNSVVFDPDTGANQ
jgi:hypothetical protein